MSDSIPFLPLFYYKYVDFFLENVNAVFHMDFAMRNIVLPLGISFFTFQQLSFLVDSYRGNMQRYGFLEYALFVSFFPQLVAGPIVLHQEMIPQFHDVSKKRINFENLIQGLEYLILGILVTFLSEQTDKRLAFLRYTQSSAIKSNAALRNMC